MGRPRKRRREDGAPNQDQDPEGSGYVGVENLKLQEPLPNIQPSVSDTQYTMSNGNALMPTWDPDINLDIPQEL